MSSPPRRASAKDIDPSALLEHLPLPCLFAALDRSVVFANGAARRLVPSLAQPAGIRSRLPDRASILDNDLIKACGLPAPAALEMCLQELQGLQLRTGQSALTLPAANEQSSSAHAWTLACCQIDGELYFSLTAAPTLAGATTTTYADQVSSEEKDWTMLQAITEPTFNSPNLVCSIMTASQASYKLNDRGRQVSSGADPQPWKIRHGHDKAHMTSENAAGGSQLTSDKDADMTSFSRRQALLTCRRCLADAESGKDIRRNAGTVLLNRPHDGGLLGVMVCSEPEEFSLYLQRYDNTRMPASATASAADGSRGRLIRSNVLNGDVDYVSPAWASYTGLHAAALHGPSWLDCVHPEDRNKFPLMEVTSPRRKDCEVRLLGRDGLYRWFSDRTEPLLDEEGQLVRWYSISEDVHDLVIKREQANADKLLLEKLIADLEIVFFTLDHAFTVSSASGTMKFDNLMSEDTYNAQSLVGVNLPEFINSISPGGIPELQRSLTDVMTGVSPKETVEYAFGPRYIRTILVPQVNEDHEPHSKDWIQGVIGTSIDITAARAHGEVKAQMKAMEETNRLKSEFLANVSHELRTPIAGMTGLVELLFETGLGPLQLDYLESIQSSAHTLLQLVNDILDFSKAEASAIMPESLPFSLSRFVDDVCKRNRVLATKKGLQFLYSPLDANIELLGDTGRIRQILDNLITNAVKFTQQGFVRLSVSHQRADNMVCVQFLIEDSGIGIEKEDLEKLFYPFAQVDQSTTRIYGGSGLGLSIARKMAEIMGGSVTLASSKGTGTEAKVQLQLAPVSIPSETLGAPQTPFTPAPAGLVGTVAMPYPGPKLSLEQRLGLHILFVEDNEINRKVVLAQLSKLGFKRVRAARNGAEAVEYVTNACSNNRTQGAEQSVAVVHSFDQSEKEKHISSWPDMIIMDCQMPIMDGYEATRQLRSLLGYDRPIIALTASAIEGDRERCIIAGMDDHVPKPVSRKDLSEMIDKWASIPASSLLALRQQMSNVSIKE